MNLCDEFLETAARQPEQLAVIDGRNRLPVSYGVLAQLVTRLASELAQNGVGDRDCVGLCLDTGLDYIVATYALWRLGACVVPVAPELRASEKQEILRNIALTRLVEATTDRAVPGLERVAQARLHGDRLACSSLRPLRCHPPGFGKINAAFIRFTSGTTGDAKGVILSHETIKARIRAANEGLEIGPDDRVLWLLSMSYHFAVTICAYLYFGATIVLCHDVLPAESVETGATYAATLIYGAPAHFRGMAAVRSPSMPNLRLAISTTAPLPAEVSAAFAARFGRHISQAYGIIEIGLPAINLEPRPHDCQSVGRVLPAYRIRFRDCGLGPEQKEVLVAGPGMMDAYYVPWRPRDRVLSDGWFATGDLGYLDADGRLNIRGRLKEVINVGGMKFFPHEIERVLREHPAIADARAFAVPDDRLGEICHAEVVFHTDRERPAEEELKRLCASRLAASKVPERIHAATEIARTASGKLRRS